MTNFVKTTADFDAAKAEIERRGWPHHFWNALKDWDSCWLDWVMRDGDLLDIGCNTSMPLWIATHLNLKGSFQGVDLFESDRGSDFGNLHQKFKIQLWKGRAEALPFPAASFDNVTCLSVIEHDVNIVAFVGELARVLRPDGRFVVTFDFWPYPKDCGLDWAELMTMVYVMHNAGLKLGPIDTTLREKVIDGRYTFGCVRGFKL